MIVMMMENERGERKRMSNGYGCEGGEESPVLCFGQQVLGWE